MPPLPAHPNRPHYSKVLSALLKTDLIRLSTEFRLPTDGSVVTLRNRLRVYLNHHRNILSRNPRYRALYPRHQRIDPPRSPSPTESFASWNGIEDQQLPPQPPDPPQQPPFHPPDYQPQPPSSSGSEPDSVRRSPTPEDLPADGRKSLYYGPLNYIPPCSAL